MTFEQMQSRQLKLSAALALLFLVTVFAVPFLHHYSPDTMLKPVLGMPLAWLLVGILFHLEFWAIAFVYSYFSNRWEAELSDD